MTANELTNAILLEIPRQFDCRLWRQNSGAAVPIADVRAAIAALQGNKPVLALQILRRARPIHMGVTGQADITGILGLDGRRIEIEVKAGRDKMRPEQTMFAGMIRGRGGLFVEAREVEDVVNHLRSEGARLK